MRTLLLADDSITTQRVVALTFADEAFRVVTVSDGQQALDAMAAGRPDIVLAGTTLPRTNGYELSERMRGSETLRDIPVLLLSGAFETVDAAKLATCGARGVIEKPLEPTAVISRVRELLGLKDARPAMPAGRLVTAADTAADARPPARQAAPSARPPQVSSWDELRKETGLEPDAHPVEGGANGSGREDYLDTLDAAFDSLDQHLAGRHQDSQASSRNPSPPLGQSSGAADPRSPGRRPAMTTEGQASNSVFEVDTDWFSDETKERDLAVGRDLVADTHVALPPRPDAGPANPIFEVDDEWFAEDEKARETRLAQQRDLAAEMGIHDVVLPAAEPVPNAPAPAEGLDFDFGLDDLAAAPVAPVLSTPVADAVPAPAPAPVAEAPLVVAPPATPAAPTAPVAPASAGPVVPPSLAPVPPGSVADDFAALLAFETGDGPAPSPVAPVVVPAPAPEVTEDMLDQIAQRVVERLNAASFGADLREAMAASVRETVRSVVSETSERLVRDEIARVRARAERDTQ
ncbi:MAG: response regulator [Acidobacteriota bacterium]|nr:response regulator [Acidobacteriota bacterium]